MFIVYLDEILFAWAHDELARFNRAVCLMQMKVRSLRCIVVLLFRHFRCSHEEADRLVPYTNQKFPEANDVLEGLLRVNPRNAAALGHKGLIFMAVERYERADVYLTKSLEIQQNPMYLKARTDTREFLVRREATVRGTL